MTDLVTRAQLEMLARTLHVEPDAVRHLEKLGAEGLFELRRRMADIMFDDHAETFRRVSALVPIVPLSIAMPLVQKMVAPMMAGRAAGAVGVDHPKKAAQALTMVKVPYAADAAPYLDPRAVSKLADVAPPEPIVEIANEILRRKDYTTASLFVDSATPELIKAVEHGVTDDEGLLRAGSYVLSGTTLSSIMRVLLDGASHRIPGMIDTLVNGGIDLQLAGVSVLSRCADDVITKVGDILFDQVDQATITQLLRNFVEAGAVTELLQFAGHMSPAALDLVAANPITEDQQILAELVRVAAGNDDAHVWRGLVDILERTADDVQRRVVELFADLDDAKLIRLAHTATEGHLWPSLLRVLAGQDGELQRKLGGSWHTLDEAVHANVRRHIHELGLDDALTTLVAQM